MQYHYYTLKYTQLSVMLRFFSEFYKIYESITPQQPKNAANWACIR
jgi:hypothetical protein